MNVFLQYFGIPNGAVWSNVLAEPIIAALTAAVVTVFRHKIGRSLVRWLHKHHAAHMAEIDREREAKGG